MSDQTQPGAKLELAHVLLIDIVGYSKLLIDDQQAAVRGLNSALRQSKEVRAADAAGKLVRLPTGDGIALVFFTTPRCAGSKCGRNHKRDAGAKFNHPIANGNSQRPGDVDRRCQSRVTMLLAPESIWRSG